MNLKKILLLVFLGLFFSGPALAEMSQSYDSIPLVMRAQDVLSKGYLKGMIYTIGPTVYSDGLVNIYEFHTTMGTLSVESTGLLQKRIREAQALYFMKEMEKTDVFKKAFKEALKGPVKTVKGLVTEPVTTVTNSVKGVGQWFSSVGQAIFSDSPDQEGVAKTALGHAAAKRAFAYEFGIDPYSKWDAVQEELNKIAWASVSGGITVKAAFHLIPEGAGIVVRGLGTSASVSKLVRDSSVGELRKYNGERLEEMGVREATIDLFLNNPNYTPYERTFLVMELMDMKGVRDRAVYMTYAARANSEAVAIFWRLSAGMMENYIKSTGDVVRLVDLAGIPFMQRRDGQIIGMFALDNLAWTPRIDKKLSYVDRAIRSLPSARGKQIWIAGRITPRAKEALKERGWEIVANVGFLPKK